MKAEIEKDKDQEKHNWMPLITEYGITGSGFARTSIDSATTERVMLLYCTYCLKTKEVKYRDE